MQRNRKQQNEQDQRSLSENQRYQENISSKDGHNKDRNGIDLKEAEDIKKRWQEGIHRTVQKQLTGITMMVWSLTQSQTCWSVKSTGPYKYYSNKASGGDGIPSELFKNLKEVSFKVLDSICQQIWKIQQ